MKSKRVFYYNYFINVTDIFFDCSSRSSDEANGYFLYYIALSHFKKDIILNDKAVKSPN